MNRQAMMEFAERMMHARDNDERAREIVGLAPDATLSRLGLARQTSTITTVLSFGGAIALGAIVGAGTALLFAPTSGQELQGKIRQQARRLSRDVKKATDQADQAVTEIRDQVTGKPHGAHA